MQVFFARIPSYDLLDACKTDRTIMKRENVDVGLEA